MKAHEHIEVIDKYCQISMVPIASNLYISYFKLNFSKWCDRTTDCHAPRPKSFRLQTFELYISGCRHLQCLPILDSPKLSPDGGSNAFLAYFLLISYASYWCHLTKQKHMPFGGTLGKSNSNSEEHNTRQHSCLIYEVRFKIIPPVHETHFEIKLETLNQSCTPLTSQHRASAPR